MYNPGSRKRVIRIFYLYALILDFIFAKPGFYLSETPPKGKSEQLLLFYE